jgi:hypothetical protein
LISIRLRLLNQHRPPAQNLKGPDPCPGFLHKGGSYAFVTNSHNIGHARHYVATNKRYLVNQHFANLLVHASDPFKRWLDREVIQEYLV